MRCAYFDAGTCLSCTLMNVPYAEQVAAKEERCRALLPHPGLRWEPTVASRESAYRNKAKMVVGGTVAAPTLGILDEHRAGVDLRGCGVIADAPSATLPAVAGFVTRCGLVPYDVRTRQGELKYVHVTGSPSGELMVRFVLRSRNQLGVLRRHLPALLGELPALRVVSVNLLPEHKAVVEGAEEIVLTEQGTLRMPLAGLELDLRPQSFFQTNSEVAAALYEQVGAWVDELDPGSVWDLYCGVGGFALRCAGPGRRVTGIELSAEAVESARSTARRTGRPDVTFHAGDATAFARAAGTVPDLVVVNPPRRGIGPELAHWLQDSGIGHVVYSSCNPVSLAADLARMPGLVPVRGRVFDMFPQTGHVEVAVLLERRDRVPGPPTG
ncbi:23S rRNA (uracil(747)-C(5))-methyltransferase RlmC [Kineococcus gynurae]|uniref:23S rRNA (Uracil(747)-C(5))-methyltransferase RlmC n=1 Tax=Kineococcus gynurae TaxID=452979 RepID=A0ABV5LVV6_9ACTN